MSQAERDAFVAGARCEQFHDSVKGAPKAFPVDDKAQLRLEI